MKATARFAWFVLPPEDEPFLEAVRPGVSAEHFERIRAMTEAFPELLGLFQEQGMSLARVGTDRFWRLHGEDRRNLWIEPGCPSQARSTQAQAQRSRPSWLQRLHRRAKD